MRPADDIKRLTDEARVVSSGQVDRRILADALADLQQRRQDRAVRPRPALGRVLMRNTTVKIAVAAAVVIALLLGLQFLGNPLGSNLTFAQVVQPILSARTVAVDTIVGQDESGPTIHDVVKGSRIRRTMSGAEDVAIIDLESGRMLTLDPQQNAAVYVDIQGPVQEGTKSYLGLVREIVTRMNGAPDLPVTQLGRQTIEGREALGLKVSEANTELTIWADVRTSRPVRIEVRQGQSFTVLKNIQFDVPVEDSLVSLEVPAGYTLHETTLDMSQFSEQDFVEALRLWAQLMLDGQFPESLRLEDLMGQMHQIGEKIERLDIPSPEKTQLGLKLWRGYTFFHVVAHDGVYRYTGQGARLGEAQRPIFWYQPPGSATWRVIYADLSVRDATPENLPQ